MIKQKIVPRLMFTGKECGHAEEAVNFYTSIFFKIQKRRHHPLRKK